jgi:hypothetical protein
MKAYGVTRMGSAAMLLAGTMAIGFGASPAAAQMADDVVLTIMRECAKIDDPTSRLGCYDNNIRAAGFGSPTVPGQNGRVSGSGAPNQRGSGLDPTGFGADDVRTPARFDSYEQRGLGPDEITARIEGVRQRQPGVYLVTLEGGAQWLFTDTVSQGFSVPEKGDQIEIRRAALGSFLMRFDEQRSVRVRRVK